MRVAFGLSDAAYLSDKLGYESSDDEAIRLGELRL